MSLHFGMRQTGFGHGRAKGVGVAKLRLVPVDANGFVLNSKQASGRVLSQRVAKNFGSNDAGTAHDPYRLAPTYIADNLNDNPVALAGYKFIAASDGAKDYALKMTTTSPFGGSYHGGEANLQAPVFLGDGALIDPTAGGDYAKVEMFGKSRVTWPTGETADVDMHMTFEAGTTLLEHKLVSASISAPNTCYPTLAFVDQRYSRMIYSGTTIDMAGSNTTYDLPVSTRSVRLVDPRTGDEAVIEFTVDRTLGRLYLLFNTNYSKLYMATSQETFGTWNVSQKVTYKAAALPTPPALPYVDAFDNATLSAQWFLARSGGAVTQSVSGGEWVLTSQGFQNRFVHPMNYPPGTYRVEVDYLTDGNYQGGDLRFVRSDSGDNTAIGTVVTLQSVTPATAALEITITEGTAPYFMFFHSTSAARVTRIREMRVNKVG